MTASLDFVPIQKGNSTKGNEVVPTTFRRDLLFDFSVDEKDLPLDKHEEQHTGHANNDGDDNDKDADCERYGNPAYQQMPKVDIH